MKFTVYTDPLCRSCRLTYFFGTISAALNHWWYSCVIFFGWGRLFLQTKTGEDQKVFMSAWRQGSKFRFCREVRVCVCVCQPDVIFTFCTLLYCDSCDWKPSGESKRCYNLWPTSQDRLYVIGSLLARLTYNLLHSHLCLPGQRFPWEHATGSSNLSSRSPHSSGGRLDSFVSGPYSSALFAPSPFLIHSLFSSRLSLFLSLSAVLWNSSDRSAVDPLWTGQQHMREHIIKGWFNSSHSNSLFPAQVVQVWFPPRASCCGLSLWCLMWYCM